MFNWPVRVYIEDTDAGGIVYYANYLKFFERARTEFVRNCGIALRAGLDAGVSYVVQSVNLKYHRPARLDDELDVTVQLEELGASYMVFSQEARRNQELLASARVKVVCVDLETLKPKRIASDLRKTLTNMKAGER
jgi:acyl-CoA thioester hydrolase